MGKSVLVLLLLASTAWAADSKVTRNISYAGSDSRRQQLDIYAPQDAKDLPVIVWMHGGGWRRGDKLLVQKKPQAFNDQGYVFVSINYRFVPDHTMHDLATDVATAIKWVHDHIAEYGGSQDTIFVGGHSAGAHLSALVCSDESYLKAQGLALTNIAGCFPVDTATYDTAKLVSFLDRANSNRTELYTNAFGETAESQKKYSPLTHINKNTKYPPFLLLHVAARPDATLMSNAFAKAVTSAGGQAETFAAKGKDHGSINSELGVPGDEPTKAVFAFLKKHQPKSAQE
ncbi:alpha/beta hydrolase [Blastopirellula marina]|uniref:Alpha/beta hydrolase n=1 Tax=Blastopirellula marina TaxID=124 RepID=A0A2S8FAE5_9BACT|nr:MULTISPECIES: alpha/beta hydrolase [Pirellulaceae]PQO29125.1 alpha/beta hydrolase [Blastopirellula marina]RCS50316.1 alpha/beta hydrolase [Bremerella cremea]